MRGGAYSRLGTRDRLANGTQSKPTTVSAATMAQASLMACGQRRLFDEWRQHCSGRLRRAAPPGAEQRYRRQADRFGCGEIARLQPIADRGAEDERATVDNRVDQRETNSAAMIAHQVEQAAGVGHAATCTALGSAFCVASA